MKTTSQRIKPQILTCWRCHKPITMRENNERLLKPWNLDGTQHQCEELRQEVRHETVAD